MNWIRMPFTRFVVTGSECRHVRRRHFLLFVQKMICTKSQWLIQLRAGLPARPSRHFFIVEDSENGKVQKLSLQGIDLQKETAK